MNAVWLECSLLVIPPSCVITISGNRVPDPNVPSSNWKWCMFLLTLLKKDGFDSHLNCVVNNVYRLMMLIGNFNAS